MSKTITVTIYDTLDGPYVDREPVHLKQNKDIEWVHADGEDFTVTFDPDPKNRPFRDQIFTPNKSNSGTPNVQSNANKVYKYSVTTTSGTIDPGVIVH